MVSAWPGGWSGVPPDAPCGSPVASSCGVYLCVLILIHYCSFSFAVGGEGASVLYRTQPPALATMDSRFFVLVVCIDLRRYPSCMSVR